MSNYVPSPSSVLSPLIEVERVLDDSAQATSRAWAKRGALVMTRISKMTVLLSTVPSTPLIPFSHLPMSILGELAPRLNVSSTGVNARGGTKNWNALPVSFVFAQRVALQDDLIDPSYARAYGTMPPGLLKLLLH